MAHIGVIALTHYDSDPRVRRETRAMVEDGHDVLIFALREAGKPKHRVVNGKHVIGLSVPRYRGDSRLAYLAVYAVFFLKALIAITASHLRKPFDLVQVHTMPDFLVFAALPVKRLGAKIILDVHELMPELYASKFGVPLDHWLPRTVKYVEKMSIAFADRALAVHEPHLEALVSHGNPRHKFSVILNVPDHHVFPEGFAAGKTENPESFILTYHGTLAPRHGLDVAIQAMAAARTRAPRLRFFIYGDGDDVPRLKALIDEIGVKDIVDLQDGMRPMEDLLPDLAVADLGVVTVIADPFTQYMLPTKLLEYMQLGIPTICTDIPTVRHYFADGHTVMVESGNVSELADHLVELAGNAALRKEISNNALAWIRENGWPEERPRYLAVVNGLLGEKQSEKG